MSLSPSVWFWECCIVQFFTPTPASLVQEVLAIDGWPWWLMWGPWKWWHLLFDGYRNCMGSDRTWKHHNTLNKYITRHYITRMGHSLYKFFGVWLSDFGGAPGLSWVWGRAISSALTVEVGFGSPIGFHSHSLCVGNVSLASAGSAQASSLGSGPCGAGPQEAGHSSGGFLNRGGIPRKMVSEAWMGLAAGCWELAPLRIGRV